MTNGNENEGVNKGDVYERKFFDIYIKPFKGVYETCKEKEWKTESGIKVTGILITVSTWSKLPVKVGVCLDGAGVDAGSDASNKVLACLTTPATGGGSSTVYVPVKAVIEKGKLVNLYVWGHNMNEVPRDFHAQVIVYYKP